jgi:hypothetical protein
MLAIRYGDAVGRALVEHKLAFAIGFVVLCAGVVIWGRTIGAAPHKEK